MSEALLPGQLARAWSADPAIAGPLALAAALYARGTVVLWARAGTAHGLRRRDVVAFAAGWTVLALALLSPLHELSETLFSAHMVQHELLMAVAAPLIVLGRPLVAFLWSMPASWRRRAARAAGSGRPAAAWRALARPSVAWLAYALATWGWHAPRLYDAALASAPIHALQHATFLATALFFWWALLHGARHRHGAAVLYLFATAVHTTALGAILALSARPLYPAYASTAAWGLSPLEDQQLAGLIMWVPACLAYLVAALALMLAWMREGDRRLPRAVAAPASLAALLLVVLLAGCDREPAERSRRELVDGNAERGREIMPAYGCNACHSIPGVRGTDARVGPPLAGIGSRSFIAGVLPNQPDNMIRWIRDPQAVDSLTAMPNLGVSARDARDIAGYLYTLR